MSSVEFFGSCSDIFLLIKENFMICTLSFLCSCNLHVTCMSAIVCLSNYKIIIYFFVVGMWQLK
jgi:hypothetical protein